MTSWIFVIGVKVTPKHILMAELLTELKLHNHPVLSKFQINNTKA